MTESIFGNGVEKGQKIDLKVWLVFGVFLIVFCIGVVMLYFWWLDPWIKGVSDGSSSGVNVVVPGVNETDVDKDGLSLKEESGLGTSDNMKDSDGDGLDDNVEIDLDTDPKDKDTDNDGFNDGVEVQNGYNPLK